MPEPINAENNRFEAMYQRWRNKKSSNQPEGQRGASGSHFTHRLKKVLLLSLIAVFAVETTAEAFVLSWYASRNALWRIYLEKMPLARLAIGSFIDPVPGGKPKDHIVLGTHLSRCQSAKWYEPDSLLGWRIRPSSVYFKQPNEIYDRVGWRISSPEGFAAAGAIDFKVQKEKAPGTYRILVLGASSVEGDGAESPLDNLPSKLKQAFDAQGRQILPAGYDRIEVINGGVGGYRVFQEYLYLVSELADLKPNLIISYSGFVDLIYAKIAREINGQVMEPFRSARHNLNSQLLRNDQSFAGAINQAIANATTQVSCLIEDTGLAVLAGKMIQKIDNQSAATSRPSQYHNGDVIATGLEAYKAGIENIVALAERRKIDLMIVLQPVMGAGPKPLEKIERQNVTALKEQEIQLRAEFRQAANSYLQSLHRANNLCITDVNDVFKDTTERVWEDSRHLLGRGNEIVAERLLREMQACQLVKQGD